MFAKYRSRSSGRTVLPSYMASEEIRQLILALPIFLLAISFHEYAHAWTAVRLGDRTPLYDGRLTLNFMSHLSLWGTIMFLIAQIGWAKPVRVTMRNLKDPKRDMLWISIAGPLANFALALAFSILLKAYVPFARGDAVGQTLVQLLSMGVWLNVLLGLFNLIPIPPLDGSKVIGPFLPVNLRHRLYAIEPWGFIIIYLLFVWGGLGRILAQAAFWTYRLLV